jgi:hypothetical protein
MKKKCPQGWAAGPLSTAFSRGAWIIAPSLLSEAVRSPRCVIQQHRLQLLRGRRISECVGSFGFGLMQFGLFCLGGADTPSNTPTATFFRAELKTNTHTPAVCGPMAGAFPTAPPNNHAAQPSNSNQTSKQQKLQVQARARSDLEVTRLGDRHFGREWTALMVRVFGMGF